MREEIARLMNLQAIDRELQELDESLAAITRQVDDLRGATENAEHELELQTSEQTRTELDRRRLERELAEGEARIRNQRMRQNLVRNEKELQALGHEVESLKADNQRLESELLAQMEGGEQRTARIKELSELLAAKSAEWKAAEKEIAGQTEELREKLGKRRAERDSLAAGIDATIRQRYDVIFSRRGGLAVVGAKSGTCQGCRRRLPPQLYNEIQKSQTIHFCPNCQRILYFEPDRENEA
ncbi:MAG: zinc ribbon domain-containing protein [Candidatus Binataceae bacterium]